MYDGIKQASFHAHFEDDKHHGVSAWEITLIDQIDSVDDLRRRESFWQYEFKTLSSLMDLMSVMWQFLTLFLTLPFSIVFIFSGLIHYIYCSTLNVYHYSARPNYFTIYPYCCYFCYYYCYYYYYCHYYYCYYYYYYYYYYDFYYHCFCCY